MLVAKLSKRYWHSRALVEQVNILAGRDFQKPCPEHRLGKLALLCWHELGTCSAFWSRTASLTFSKILFPALRQLFRNGNDSNWWASHLGCNTNTQDAHPNGHKHQGRCASDSKSQQCYVSALNCIVKIPPMSTNIWKLKRIVHQTVHVLLHDTCVCLSAPTCPFELRFAFTWANTQSQRATSSSIWELVNKAITVGRETEISCKF